MTNFDHQNDRLQSFWEFNRGHIGVDLQLVIESVVGKLMKLILVGDQTSCPNMLSLVKTRSVWELQT